MSLTLGRAEPGTAAFSAAPGPTAPAGFEQLWPAPAPALATVITNAPGTAALALLCQAPTGPSHHVSPRLLPLFGCLCKRHLEESGLC